MNRALESTPKILRGNSLSIMREMEAGSIDAVITDPPYSSGGQFSRDRAKDTKEKYLTTGKIAAEYAQLTDYDINSFPVKQDPFMQIISEMMGEGVKASLVRSFLGDDVYKQYLLVNRKTTPLDMVQAIISYE